MPSTASTPESTGSADSRVTDHGRLRTVLRTGLVPFVAVLFPAVHYLGRNLTNETLYPYVEPTPTAYALWGLVALVVSAAIGLACGLLLYVVVIGPSADERGVAAHPDDSLLWRTLLLDARTVRVYLALVAVIGIWAITNLGGVGPESLAALLSVAVVPFALPLLVLAPVAIASHVGVVVGYGACALWTAVLARLFVERVAGRHDGTPTGSG
mgnify:CR=1 FL=1